LGEEKGNFHRHDIPVKKGLFYRQLLAGEIPFFLASG
jgi:hypothetical protein